MITDVYAQRKYQEGMCETWGHLAPKKGQSYKGYMIYAHSGYGDIVLLEANFKNLSDSPWLFEAMQDYIGEHCQCEGLYKWKGCCEMLDDGSFCFGGKIKRLDWDIVRTAIASATSPVKAAETAQDGKSL